MGQGLSLGVWLEIRFKEYWLGTEFRGTARDGKKWGQSGVMERRERGRGGTTVESWKEWWENEKGIGLEWSALPFH